MQGYELYTYFGRVIERLPFNHGELAINTQSRATDALVLLEKNGVNFWIRLY